MPSATVTIKKNKDMEKAIRTFEQDAIDIVRKRIQIRAKEYVAVDTGKLKSSIRFLGRFSVGSTVRYAGYQEGTAPTYTRFTPYMRPALRDVMRSLPGLMGDTWRKSLAKTPAGPTKSMGFLGKVMNFFRGRG